MTDRAVGERPAIVLSVAIRCDGPADAFRPYDPRTPAVAQRVIDLLRSRVGLMPVEHIGSTAVPGEAAS